MVNSAYSWLLLLLSLELRHCIEPCCNVLHLPCSAEWYDSKVVTNVQGVPAKHVLKEVSSYDTVGNAYFSLVIHALPADWR